MTHIYFTRPQWLACYVWHVDRTLEVHHVRQRGVCWMIHILMTAKFMYPLSHESISTTIIENKIARHGCGVNQQASFNGEVQHKPLKRFLYHVKLLIAVHANNSSYHHLMVTKLSTTVAHMWVSKGGQDVFGKWLAACSVLSHDLKQQCVIFNWTLVIKVHWNFNQIVMEMSLTKWLAFYFSASKC